MKNITKQALMVVALATLAAPSFAADVNKGTKSYQARSEKTDQAPANTDSAEDVSKIAPAAGDQATAEDSSEKSFKEELRLPRKN
jgi:hypothetical protein